MIYLAIFGYAVSVYTVYKWFEPDWDTDEISPADVIAMVAALIIILMPVLNSMLTLATWCADLFLWAYSVKIYTRKK